MIRFAFSAMLVLAGVTLPVWGGSASAAHPAATFSSKGGSKAITTPVPAPASAPKSEKTEKTVVVVTSDISRASRSAMVSAHQPAPAPLLSGAGRVTVTAESQTALVVRNSPTPSIRNVPVSSSVAAVTPVRTATGDVDTAADGGRLARVTAYWRGEGDYYTGRSLSATGVRLHDGHCAVDPNIIPYGSVVDIKGVGKFLAVDTGSAVISRTAAREGGKTEAERHAIVVDVYFEDSSEGERFAAGDAKYVSISWWTPHSTGTEARAARSLFAEEDWTKIQGKQL